MILSWDETPDGVLDMFRRFRDADYVVSMRVQCGSQSNCEYNGSFDVGISEVHEQGLMVRSLDHLYLANPPFCAAFFAWDDIAELYVY